MNIHEYQARELLAAAGVTVPRGAVARTPEEAESIARSLPCNSFVVKAQVHAGGRGKAGGVLGAPSGRAGAGGGPSRGCSGNGSS